MSEHDPDAAPEPSGGLFGPQSAAPGGPVIDHAPPPEVQPAAPRARRGGTPFSLTLLITALLAGGIYYVWSHPKPGAGDSGQTTGSAGADSVRAELGQQILSLSARVETLEKQASSQPPAQAAAPQPAAASQDAVAEQAKKLDDLSGRIDALSGKQDQIAAQAAKALEVAGQQATAPASGGAPPPDRTAQQVPGLEAQQQANDQTKVPGTGPSTSAPGSAPDQTQEKAALDQIDQRLTKLEQAGAQTQGADAQAQQAGAQQTQAALAALGTRLDKLEQTSGQEQSQAAAAQTEKAQTQQAGAQQAEAALAALGARLDKLEQTTGQVQSQEAAAQAQQTRSQQAEAALAVLGTRLDKLEQTTGQVQSQDSSVQSAEAAQAKAQQSDTQAIDALQARVVKLEAGVGQTAGVAQDATRAIKIEAAAAALQAGQPLGKLPGAPPALSRFATTAPPTEGALRAAFPEVADRARAASQPATSPQRSLLDRTLARLQQSVVVRQGDRVLVGDPAAGVLARAQQDVSADDLKSAVTDLSKLQGPAADAVRDWVGQAQALLDARAALAVLAAHG